MKIHAIVDDLEAAQRAIAIGATVLQFRVKGSTAERVARGSRIRSLGTTFVVDGDVDAALELAADGLQLGYDDAGGERARARGLMLGRSVATDEQALSADADYLSVGPIWRVRKPEDAGAALGLAELGRICRAVPVPVIAFGGIDASNAGECIRAGAAGVAAIRDAIDPALRDAVDDALRAR